MPKSFAERLFSGLKLMRGGVAAGLGTGLGTGSWPSILKTFFLTVHNIKAIFGNSLLQISFLQVQKLRKANGSKK